MSLDDCSSFVALYITLVMPSVVFDDVFADVTKDDDDFVDDDNGFAVAAVVVFSSVLFCINFGRSLVAFELLVDMD